MKRILILLLSLLLLCLPALAEQVQEPWICMNCGQECTAQYCSVCSETRGCWTCVACGTRNLSSACMNCGKRFVLQAAVEPENLEAKQPEVN